MTYKVKVRRKMVDVMNENGATLAWTSIAGYATTHNGLWYITPALSAQDLVSLSTFLLTLDVKRLIEKGDTFLSPVS